VDTARDRAGVDPWHEADRWQDGDPWRESLERSLARRHPSPRAANRRDRPHARRSAKRILNAKAIAALALVAAILTVALSGRGPDASPSAASADATRGAATGPSHAAPSATTPAAAKAGWRGCPLAVSPAGYVNPLAAAIVKPERIDQGVDYAGIGKLSAIGSGRVTYLATDDTGWPGAFIEYQLLDGADAGCYVYYAEGVTPADGLHVGDTVTAGQPIATIIPIYPTGIEIGWGAGDRTKAYAKVAGQWSPTDDEDNIASAAGKSFSSLIAALGGPPGKVEGRESGPETSSAQR
jgi:murein DD-endopeptidase MepM/ murein hydrolase activator NlpD